MKRWRNRKTISVGRITRTAPAEIVSQWAPKGPLKRNSDVEIAGFSSGKTILRQMVKAFAPSSRAASSQVATDFSGDAGARATRSLLTAAPQDRPTAIVYDRDIMAVAGLSVATETGLRVPADVSLPAWDDSQLCRLTHPTLSAMSHDVHGFGAEVARTLFGAIMGGAHGSHPVPTPVLTPRGSTAPPKV